MVNVNKILNKFILEVTFFIIIFFILFSYYSSFFPIRGNDNPLSAGILFLAIWNILPATICYFLFKKGLPFWKLGMVQGMLVLETIILILQIVFYLSWVLTPNDIKFIHSTSGIELMFVPFGAMLFSAVPAIVLLVYIHKQKKLH